MLRPQMPLKPIWGKNRYGKPDMGNRYGDITGKPIWGETDMGTSLISQHSRPSRLRGKNLVVAHCKPSLPHFRGGRSQGLGDAGVVDDGGFCCGHRSPADAGGDQAVGEAFGLIDFAVDDEG